MGIARSTYYGAPAADRDAEIVARIEAICAEFEAYGYRRVTAELRHQGQLVNSKRVRRLMREHGLSPKQRRRYVTTTDSDHDEPIFPNLAADMAPDGPNQLWVADITYVAIATGFRSVTDSSGRTTFYNNMGRNTGRAVTRGGTTTIYDNMGRQTGTIRGSKVTGRFRGYVDFTEPIRSPLERPLARGPTTLPDLKGGGGVASTPVRRSRTGGGSVSAGVDALRPR